MQTLPIAILRQTLLERMLWVPSGDLDISRA